MGSSPADWGVVTDFDGTLTTTDIGNELCLVAAPEKYRELQGAYRRGELGLKEYQHKMWMNFPLSESEFCAKARSLATLREGVVEFFEFCQERSIPIFVASCGLRPYIEVVLKELLSKKAQLAIQDVRCNDVRFSSSNICEFTPPKSEPTCPYPLDKGAWSSELRLKIPLKRILGIGNGTSDRSFVGHVDHLAATEALAQWCVASQTKHTFFESFNTLSDILAP